jgi:hypothetical protein
MKVFFVLIFFTSFVVFAEDEATLSQRCSNKEISACEKLGALYLGRSDWEKSYIIGEALCENEQGSGCTLAGSSRLAQGKIKEGHDLLVKACDHFDALGCRSVARLMVKADEKALARMYFKRACHYGLSEICDEIKKHGSDISAAARELLTNLDKDCKDTKSTNCHDHLSTIKNCALPLNRLDCQLLAGHLATYFRAKLLQAEARALLLLVHGQQKLLKEKGSYTYDLHLVIKESDKVKGKRYVVGLMKECGKKYVKGNVRTSTLGLYPSSYRHIEGHIQESIFDYFGKGSASDCYDPKSGYEAYAVASLDPVNTKRLDVWKIDQDQRIENVVDGLPLP